MTNEINFNELLKKPVAMMTGEELLNLLHGIQPSGGTEEAPTTSKKFYHGIGGIAEIFGCSGPTASRIKKSGVIDAAITQVGRKIVIDGEMALKLVKEKNK